MKLTSTLFLSVTFSLLTGCASTLNNPDPYESFNRDIYGINKGLDKAILRPAAVTYRAVLPEPVRASVTNFLSNIDDVPVLANNLLQSRWHEAGITIQRLLLNTTFGVFGLFDAAVTRGLSKQHGDFGQTLGVWGIKQSPYLVLPLIGPRTTRDTVGSLVDYVASPWAFTDTEVRITATMVDIVGTRTHYLDQDAILNTVPDEYLFVRNAYLQRRAKIIAGDSAVGEETWADVGWDEDGHSDSLTKSPL